MLTPERKSEIRRECDSLAEIAAKRIGASAWYDHARHVLTPAEYQEVMSIWGGLPGSCSWMQAFFVWFND